MTELNLYNTLTRRKEMFKPIDIDNVRMYVCGPTVYDYAHIGNARSVIVFDVLYRLLRHIYGEERVTYVRNITDVDDKINARALQTHGRAVADGTMSLNDAIREVTEKTANQYRSDMKALGCLEPTHQPRATEFVLPRADGKTDMESMIQTLLDKGHAYVAFGSQGREVLFRVNSMQDYGALSNRKLEDQQAGARVAVESHKENPADFVLWKESSASEPGWDGKFNSGKGGEIIRGRPGWHIECSAMSQAYLGQTFDIHGGGLDLIFPHHENEIAQSRCCHGTEKMANIWMHNGILQVEGEKMSKSVGNFHTVHEVLETTKVGGRKWPGAVLRLALLMTHYREPVDFTLRRLEEAEKILRKFADATRNVSAPDTALVIRPISAILDDLNCSRLLFELQKLAKRSVDGDQEAGSTLKQVIEFLGLENIDMFATEFLDLKQEDPDGRLRRRIAQREAHIGDKNWVEADRIRDDLLAEGIQLKDSKDPDTGKRITTWEVKR